MKTITQIGKAALTRLFNPRIQTIGKVTTDTSVSFPKGDYDLTPAPTERSISDHMHYPQKYFVWSIELGLFQLELQFNESLLDTIAQMVKKPRRTTFEEEYAVEKELIIPTHLIFFQSSSMEDIDHTIIDDVYTVYRLNTIQELCISQRAKSLQ